MPAIFILLMLGAVILFFVTVVRSIWTHAVTARYYDKRHPVRKQRKKSLRRGMLFSVLMFGAALIISIFR